MAKVLIIEDEKVLAEMYKNKFELEGLETDTVFSAEEAGEFLEKNIPDLILLDMLLPRDNGIEFLQKMIKKEKLKDIPVIAFSNYSDPKTKEKALELGVKEYLIKTQYDPGQIVGEIKKYLKK